MSAASPGAICVSVMLSLGAAGPTVAPGLYGGFTAQPVTLEGALQDVRSGEVVVIGEQHDVPAHHENQLAVLRALKNLKLNVGVGFELFSYPDQPWLDRYLDGEIPESVFLQKVHWDGLLFEWYRPLILFPREAGGQARAFNAPAHLAAALARQGLVRLSAEERSWLPPGFRLGNALYFERFAREARQHGAITAPQTRRFFAAQSAWDDTMAWQASEYLKAHPDHTLAVIVGDFHVSYGGGLPDRLRSRSITNILVISQVNGYGLSDGEVRRLLEPDPRYGARGDFVWLTRERPRR
ncbi:MAG TPA: ChaN family lipoprotein [bacterium]|nr:ChaN family lipoprotein [bacterium]